MSKRNRDENDYNSDDYNPGDNKYQRVYKGPEPTLEDMPAEIKQKIILAGSLSKKDLSSLKRINEEFHDLLKDPDTVRELCYKNRENWSLLKTSNEVIEYMYANPNGVILSSHEMYYWDLSLLKFRIANEFTGVRGVRRVLNEGTIFLLGQWDIQDRIRKQIWSPDQARTEFNRAVEVYLRFALKETDPKFAIKFGTEQVSGKWIAFMTSWGEKRFTKVSLVDNGEEKLQINPNLPLVDNSFLNNVECRQFLEIPHDTD